MYTGMYDFSIIQQSVVVGKIAPFGGWWLGLLDAGWWLGLGLGLVVGGWWSAVGGWWLGCLNHPQQTKLKPATRG